MSVPPTSLTIPDIKVSTSEYVNDDSCSEENVYCNVTPHTANAHALQADPDSHRDLLRRRHTSHVTSCRRYTYAKSIVAEPPSANKDEVAKARYKLHPNTPTSLQV